VPEQVASGQRADETLGAEEFTTVEPFKESFITLPSRLHHPGVAIALPQKSQVLIPLQQEANGRAGV
jgi:hypothetical protein